MIIYFKVKILSWMLHAQGTACSRVGPPLPTTKSTTTHFLLAELQMREPITCNTMNTRRTTLASKTHKEAACRRSRQPTGIKKYCRTTAGLTEPSVEHPHTYPHGLANHNTNLSQSELYTSPPIQSYQSKLESNSIRACVTRNRLSRGPTATPPSMPP